MELGLGGKIALVGGGSSGIGRATAEALVREGVSVAIYALSNELLPQAVSEIETATGGSVMGIAADIRSAEDCRRVVDETVAAFGKLDIAVINMAGSYGAPLPDTDEEWTAAWEMWSLSSIRLSRFVVPHLRSAGGGSIVNITSCGIHQMVPETALSEIPRLATTGFSKYLARQLASENIRINNVLPGWISTHRSEDRWKEEGAARGLPPESIYEEEAAPIPMGRFGTPAEVADAITFLVSDRAGYLTGVNLRIDGGWCLGPTA
jgi:3-oxoacyl-[acyl-carrier protein] reductase